MFLISGIALLLLGSFITQAQTLQTRLDYYNSRLESLEAQIEEEKARTIEIRETEEYMKTDEYIESVAREKLGLVKENEIIFKEAQ
ncbi:MAG: septum formation initiator family protein [Eubacteriales bacterium]|nr:septum formation initiator family protein [Eubacteriales bacterium]